MLSRCSSFLSGTRFLARLSSTTTKSFYQRPLPSSLISFSSNKGRKLFKESLLAGTMEGYFSLAEQFQTQTEPAYCGPSTLSMILNALNLDPNRNWKGPWRWYSEEMLQTCDVRKPKDHPLHEVDKVGWTFEEFLLTAECNGAGVQAFRSSLSSESLFRSAVLAACSRTDLLLVVSFARAGLEQTGCGHYSPIGGYNAEHDLVLVLDVARFKYPPYWVPLSTLWKAICVEDPSTKQGRGYYLLSRGRQVDKTEFTPHSTTCRILTDRGTWDHLAQFLCQVLPKHLSQNSDLLSKSQRSTSSSGLVEALLVETLRSLPLDFVSIFTMYGHDLTRRLSGDSLTKQMHTSSDSSVSSSSSSQQLQQDTHSHHHHFFSYASYLCPNSHHFHPHVLTCEDYLIPFLTLLQQTPLVQRLQVFLETHPELYNEFLTISSSHLISHAPTTTISTPTPISKNIRFHLASGFVLPTEDSHQHHLELAALILFALPKQVFYSIESSWIREDIEKLLNVASLPTQLQREIAVLRQQLGVLADFCKCSSGLQQQHDYDHPDKLKITIPNEVIAETLSPSTQPQHIPDMPETTHVHHRFIQSRRVKAAK